MSAKLIYSLADEKKDLKTQMGCMNGLFQLLDRRHFMGGRRVNPKRLPSPGCEADHQPTEAENASDKAKGANPRHDTIHRHRVSCESLRTAISSEIFTYSKKAVKPQPSSADQETSSHGMLHTDAGQSPKITRHSDHLGIFVKENITREVPRSLVKIKTPAKKGVTNVLKHIDSPRPLPIKPKFAGLDESFKKLGKFREIHNEAKDGCRLMTRTEAHRFSCDGRVTNLQDTLKSSLKLKEQPRLSLDSRACSGRRKSEYDNYASPKVEHTPDSNKRTSIIAKLMGLQITECMSTGNSDESNEPSNAEDEASQQIVASGFLQHPSKNFIQSRNQDKITKPVSTSKGLVEAAPWKDAHRSLQKPGFGEPNMKVPNLMPSVYGEMEKHVTELEFTKSSRDLRALKQILGAMQKSKDNLQMKRGSALDQSSIESMAYSSHHQELKSGDRSSAISNWKKGHQKQRASQVVAMKPTNTKTEGLSGLRKLRTPGATLTSDLRDVSSPTLCTDKNSIASPRGARKKASRLDHPLAVEKNISGRSSAVVSPRLQHRQLRFDKKISQTSQSSEPVRTQRQPIEAGSPVKRDRLKASTLHNNGDKFSEVRINPCSSIQLDYSSRSDSNISQSSEFVTEVTIMADLDEMNAAFSWKSHIKQENKSASSERCRAVIELNIISPEQPSPVSVLDPMFYSDDSPSPVKKISNAYIDDESFNPEEEGWSIKHGTCDSTRSLTSTDYDPEIVNNSEHLFEEQVVNFGNSVDDYGLPHCEGKDQKDHEYYIYEILLASGLLQDPRSGLVTIQPCQSAHALRPEIFEILEMKNAKRNLAVNKLSTSSTIPKQSMDNDKIQRKLIFDFVNESLGRKSIQSSYNELSLLATKVADTSQAKQKLLKDLHSEINQLQVAQSKWDSGNDYDESLRTILLEDMQQYGSESNNAISRLVLDVERLIFKDLISEIIRDAAEGPRIRQTSHCRQLFPK